MTKKTDKKELKEEKTDTTPNEKKSQNKVATKDLKEEKKVEFTDADIAEFKAWKEAKAKENQMTCDAADEDKVYRMWKEEKRIVKGIFRCREPEGGTITFPFRKYKWDKTKWYTMVDGETYEVPLAVARHLNKNCSYEVHSHILDSQGNPTVSGKPKSRMNFESTEFAVA